jgi:hypothetical protein
MKGRARILLGVMALILLCSVFASAQKLYPIPTVEKLLRPGLTVVKYDRTAYYFSNNEPVVITLTKLDDRYVDLKIETALPVPTTVVTLWWGDFPFNTLTVGTGGDNSWTLDSETGYAEK